MESIIKKIVPCEFKKSAYECTIQGLRNEPLSCEKCGSYKPKNPIPKAALILRPSDYMVIASDVV